MQTLPSRNSTTVRIVAALAGAFAALGGCSSSDKSPAASTGAIEGGHPEASVKYKECKTPQDLLSGVDNSSTGYVICANSIGTNAIHRTEIKACPSRLPRTATCTGLGSGTDSGAQIGICRSDADCTQGTEGHCIVSTRSPACSCFYGCKSDADCTSERVCVCGDPTGECVLAHCKSDADCSPGSFCLSASDGACRKVFACQTPKDDCAGDKDCTLPPYSQCTFNGDHRVCKEPPNCGI